MNGPPAGKLPQAGVSRKSGSIRDLRSTNLDGKALHQNIQGGAKATLAAADLHSPRRPTIAPESDEQLTRQRRDEEALLRAIEGAMRRNDDASAEELRLQLKGVQRLGVALRERLASKDSPRTQGPGTAEQLQACRREIEKLLESVRPLKDELQAAEEYVQTLKSRIGAFVAEAEVLAKEFGALSALAAPNPETKQRNVVGDDVTHALRYQESSAVEVSLAVAPGHQRSSLQRLIDQEKNVTRRIDQSTSPRGVIPSTKKKSHRGRDAEKNKARKTIDLSSAMFEKPMERDDSHIVPASPFSTGKRATFNVLPPHETGRKSQRESSEPQKKSFEPKGWQTSVGSPRHSVQPATPRLGLVRKDVGEAIANLLGSMPDATDEQIEDALKKLERIEGSRQNLHATAQECLEKARAARSKSEELEKHAAEMEVQAATLQKINEGAMPRSTETIAALRAELARRASRQGQDADTESIEFGTVEQVKERAFGERTFTDATFSLDDVLAQLGDLASTSEPELGRQKPHVDDKKQIASRPLGGTAGISGAQSSRAEDKLEEHSEKYKQFKRLAAQEKTALQKWKAKVASQKVEGSQKPTGEVSGMDSTSNM